MTVINLTQEYLRNGNPSLYERVMLNVGLDLYGASSIAAINEHFRIHIPRRKSLTFFAKSAFVVLRGVEIRRTPLVSLEQEDGFSFQDLNNGKLFPLFEVKDTTMVGEAYWMAGNSEEYSKAQKAYGFNSESYVNIPKIFLQYVHIDEGGFWNIRSLNRGRKIQPEKKSLKDKIFELPTDLVVQPV
jgi:hypothetical protein